MFDKKSIRINFTPNEEDRKTLAMMSAEFPGMTGSALLRIALAKWREGKMATVRQSKEVGDSENN